MGRKPTALAIRAITARDYIKEHRHDSQWTCLVKSSCTPETSDDVIDIDIVIHHEWELHTMHKSEMRERWTSPDTAEYWGLKETLLWLKKLIIPGDPVVIYINSPAVGRQLSGTRKTEPGLYRKEVISLLMEMPHVDIQWINSHFP